MPDHSPATATDLAAAHHIYSGNWDAAGTTTVHLPDDIARRLLHVRGWTGHQHPRGGASWIAPTGERIWHTSEALGLALTAEVIPPTASTEGPNP